MTRTLKEARLINRPDSQDGGWSVTDSCLDACLGIGLGAHSVVLLYLVALLPLSLSLSSLDLLSSFNDTSMIRSRLAP